jgi:putative spermidine/putrescine transport system substrate-binding protein
MRRMLIVCLLVFIGAGLALAGGKSETTSAAASQNLLSVSWDQLVAAAKQEGKVTFYAWYKENYFSDVAKAFKDKYGIDANVVIGTQDANFNKALAEKASATGTIDAMVLGGVMVQPAIAQHMVYGPLQARIPDADKIPAANWKTQEGVQIGGFLVPFMRNQTGLLYDPKRVDDPPRSWEQLSGWIDAHPKQFGFNDPQKGGAGQAFVQTLLKYTAGGLDAYYGDSAVDQSKVADWPKAWDWVNQRKDKITITASNNDTAQRLNDGEISLGVEWDDVAVAMMGNGQLSKAAKLYIPQMGLAGGGDSIAVMGNAAHKAAAILFTSFVVSAPEQAAINAAAVGLYPARTDVDAPNTLIASSERQYSIPWIPGPYKTMFISEFVKNVLMKQ